MVISCRARLSENAEYGENTWFRNIFHMVFHARIFFSLLFPHTKERLWGNLGINVENIRLYGPVFNVFSTFEAMVFPHPAA